jgi:hypothetical protein
VGINVLQNIRPYSWVSDVAKHELVQGVVVALGVGFQLQANQLATVLAANDLAHVRLEPEVVAMMVNKTRAKIVRTNQKYMGVEEANKVRTWGAPTVSAAAKHARAALGFARSSPANDRRTAVSRAWCALRVATGLSPVGGRWLIG